MKSRLFFLPLLFLCCAAGGAEQDEMRLISGIAAIANDALVTIREATILASASHPRLARLQKIDPAEYTRQWMEKQKVATELLIERQLILDDFKNSGIIFPESLIDEQIQNVIRDEYRNRAELAKTLQAEGMTFDGFRQQKRENFILKVMEQRNVKQALIISPAKIEAYYQTNLTKYKLDDQMKVRQIVLKCGASTCDETRVRAQEILNIINAGASFSNMAGAYTDGGDWQRENGGDLGLGEKLCAGFADVAADLHAGKHSGVFSKAREGTDSYWIYFYDAAGKITRGRHYSIKEDKESFVEEKPFASQANHEGLPALPQEFYLLKVDEKKIAHTRPINEVRDEIETHLIFQERARLHSKWIERLKAKSFVRRF